MSYLIVYLDVLQLLLRRKVITIISLGVMEYWERIKDRYDVAFIGAATTILIGIAFIFFTIVVSDWMFPKNNGRNSATLATEEPVEAKDANCTESRGLEVNVENNSTLESGNQDNSTLESGNQDNSTLEGGEQGESSNHDNGG